MDSDLRITTAEWNELLSEKEYLRVQLNELNEILSIREEELNLLRTQLEIAAENKSLFEEKEIALQALHVKLLQEQQKLLGGKEREKELEKELQDSLVIYKQYAQLFQDFTNVKVRLEDLELASGALKKAVLLEEALRRRLGELESKLSQIQEK